MRIPEVTGQPSGGGGFAHRLGRFLGRLGARRGWFLAGLAILVIVALYLIGSTVITVKPGERAVIFSRFSGVMPQPLGEGWHAVVPYVWQATMYDVKTQTWTISIGTPGPKEAPESDPLTALTLDGQQVQLDLSVRYHPDPANVPRLHQRLGPEYLNKVIRPLTRCLARMVVSEYPVTDVYSGKRQELQTRIGQELGKALLAEDIVLDDFLLRNVKFSEDFEKAIEAKQVASQEVEQMQYVLDSAEKEKQSKIVEAEGEAEAIRLQGKALKRNPLLIRYEYARKVAPRVQTLITDGSDFR
jgi:regulator of protease activity HflC (stomatin/prohibitin superfamily)